MQILTGNNRKLLKKIKENDKIFIVMANYATLKSTIEDNIKENGIGAITGPVLQSALLSMINSLGVGYQFMGFATPSTNPGTPDQRVFYLACKAGIYSNFGGTIVKHGQLGIFAYDDQWVYNVEYVNGIDYFASEPRIPGFVREIFVYGTGVDKTHTYRVSGARIGNESQTYRVTFQDASTSTLVAVWNGNTRESILHIPSYGNSGVEVLMLVDWDVLDQSSQAAQTIYGNLNEHCFDITYSPILYAKQKTDVTDILETYPVVSNNYAGSDGVVGKYYKTDNVSIGGFINPNRLRSSSSLTAFCFQLPSPAKISIKEILTESEITNIVITDLNFKILQLINVDAGTQTDVEFVAPGAGYVLLSNKNTSNIEIEIAHFDSNTNSNYVSLRESNFEIAGKFISADYAESLQVGETIDENRFTNNANFSVAKLPVNKGDKITLMAWYLTSSDKYLVFTDISKKVISVVEFDGTLSSDFNKIYEIETNGYLYISQYMGTTAYVQYSSVAFNRFREQNYNGIDAKLNDLAKTVDSIGSNQIIQVKTLDETIFARMKSGDAVKIGFLGDSTTDGVGTTGFNRATNGHEGSQWDNIYNDGPGTIGSTDYINQEAYPYKLEQLLKAETGNTSLRVYNMGWTGKTYQWAYNNRADIFGGAYSDVEVVGLMFGINDTAQYGSVLKTVISTYKSYLTGLIEYIHSLGKGAFIVNPQCAIKGEADGYPTSNQETALMFRKINREIATKYGIALLELTDFDVNLVVNSSLPCGDIMNDRLHFTSLGHTFEAGFMFAQIVSRVACCSKQTIISYNNFNWLDDAGINVVLSTAAADIYEGFKTCMSSDASGNDVSLMDVYILNDSDSDKEIFGYVKNLDTQHCIVTDTLLGSSDVSFASVKQKLADLKVGEFKHFVIKSGTGRREFYGIKME